jgi:hypothetical protein
VHSIVSSPTSSSWGLEWGTDGGLRRINWGSRALLLVAGALTVLTTAINAQNNSDDLSKDQDYREELGVNEFTAPSIEKLFSTLDSLKPIPVNLLTRPITELNTSERVS